MGGPAKSLVLGLAEELGTVGDNCGVRKRTESDDIMMEDSF